MGIHAILCSYTIVCKRRLAGTSPFYRKKQWFPEDVPWTMKGVTYGNPVSEVTIGQVTKKTFGTCDSSDWWCTVYTTIVMILRFSHCRTPLETYHKTRAFRGAHQWIGGKIHRKHPYCSMGDLQDPKMEALYQIVGHINCGDISLHMPQKEATHIW